MIPSHHMLPLMAACISFGSTLATVALCLGQRGHGPRWVLMALLVAGQLAVAAGSFGLAQWGCT